MNTKQSCRVGTVRVGILGAVLLCSLAVAQRAEANSCSANVTVQPINQSSTVCGTSLGASVPFTGSDGNGTATATNLVTLGALHALTSVVLTVPTLVNSALCCAVSQIQNSSFTFDDLVISGPVGTIGTTLTVSFNVAISGALTAVTTGTNMLAMAEVGTVYTLAGTSGQGILQATNGGGFSASGILSGVAASQGTINNTLRTGVATVTVGTPFSFSLLIGENSIAGPTNFCNGGCVGTAAAIANFANTLGLPTTGPVANLPAGYTLNSASGLIVNNQFTPTPAPTPEPSTLLLLGSGLLALAGAARRKLLD